MDVVFRMRGGQIAKGPTRYKVRRVETEDMLFLGPAENATAERIWWYCRRLQTLVCRVSNVLKTV